MCNARSTTTLSSSKKNQLSADASSSSSSSSRYETVQRATAPCAPEPIEIDIGNLSTEDLQSLKQDDPFLYYSIPAVRRAALNLEEPDVSALSSGESTSTITVKRCTRVSFECHTDVLMEDLLGDFDEGYDESELEQMDLEISKLLDLAYGNAR